jgi:hypothetical protein
MICGLVAGCGSRPPESTAVATLLAPARTPTPEATFFVDVWVDNPTPARDDKVILIGMLNMQGVFLNGITMQATWPDAQISRGVPNCNVQLSYGRGVCVIDAGKYPPGTYVPIRVSFEYRGGVYVGETGFTPQP